MEACALDDWHGTGDRRSNNPPIMNKLFPLALFIGGLVLVYFGLEASDCFGSAVSEVVNDASSNKSIMLMIGGVLASVAGLAGLVRSKA